MKYLPEVWKTREFNDLLLRHCDAVYKQNTIDRWTKGWILPFPKKGDLEIANNYWGITLTSIMDKIFNALLLHHIESKIEKILRKNPKWLSEKLIHDITKFDNPSNSRRCMCKKNLDATILFVDFSKAFDSIHRGKMEQILFAYGLLKEIVAAIIMLYKNTKVKVHSLDGGTDYFNIVAGVPARRHICPIPVYHLPRLHD